MRRRDVLEPSARHCSLSRTSLPMEVIEHLAKQRTERRYSALKETSGSHRYSEEPISIRDQLIQWQRIDTEHFTEDEND